MADADSMTRLNVALEGRYRIERELGAGGMATVYLAEDVRHHRSVAVKVLKPELAAVVGSERFLAEIETTANLQHPHILPLFDSGETDGFLFYVMPYVEGESLRERLTREHQLPVTDAVDIASKVAGALDYAHSHRVIHRDIKPANILLNETGEPLVSDFGIALAVSAGGGNRLTETGLSLGTPHYMSPEQATGDLNVGPQTDIWALGCMLYEMLVGEPPFTGSTPQAVLGKIITGDIPAASEERESVSPHLDAVIRKALEKLAADRFATAGELSASLADPDFRHGETDEPESTLVPRRWSGFAIGFGIALALVALTLTVPRWITPEPVPSVTGYTQVTRTQLTFPPTPSPYPLLTDGSRIYLNDWANSRMGLRQVPLPGGEAVPLDPPFAEEIRLNPQDISRDGSDLLLTAFEPSDIGRGLWRWPLVGGTARRLGSIPGAQSAGWSADESILVYGSGRDLYVAGGDGNDPRKLLTASGRIYWPRVSPDGERIRFTAMDPGTDLFSLWEVAIDGTGLAPLFPDKGPTESRCCGSWTPDGDYYVFQATRDHRTHIWAMREGHDRFGMARSPPVQLTAGPMDFIRPLVPADGHRLFAIGWQLRGELVRYDSASEQFVPHLPSLSAEWLAYSRDGEWLTYVTYPEAELWRSRSDGMERLRLTFSPMRARRPEWSPDGRTIAFEGQVPDENWKIHMVSVDGGTPRPLTSDERPEDAPTWSADGGSIAFSVGDEPGIRIYDLESGEESVLEDSEDLHGPSWSPDGRYLAAHSRDQQRLLVFDFTRERWEEVASTNLVTQYWSGDGSHLYFHRPFWQGERHAVHRVRIPDGPVERVVGLNEVRKVWGVGGMWTGVTPDGSPMVLRDLSIHHVYALDWER